MQNNRPSAASIVSSKLEKRRAALHPSLAFPIVLYVAGALIFFRAQIFSYFDLTFGNRGDARMVVFLHEHVYRWLSIHGDLLTPPFFYNQTKTLGYTDAFLLDQIFYAPLRLWGADPLLATSLVAIFLSPVAYLCVYLLLRRFDVSTASASLSAFIFTFANNLYLKSGHFQHFAVYFIPLIALLASVAISELHRKHFRACVFGAFAAALYGLLFSTGFYIAWFFGFALLIFSPIAGSVAIPEVRKWWSKGRAHVVTLGLVAGSSFLAALSIFTLIYAPVLAMGVRRAFSDYLIFAPEPIDIVNVGIANLVWSGVIRSLDLIGDDRLSFVEFYIALTPTVQILTLASAAVAFRPGFWPANDIGRLSRGFVIASVCVCVLFYLVTIKVHNFSLFQLLYMTVPGANAIRAGYRGMVVANLFAATAIGLTFDRAIRLTWQNPGIAFRKGWLAILTALLSLAALEQINLAHPTTLSREFERKHFGALTRPPPRCRSFYVAPQAERQPYEVQIDAMMAALTLSIPTINGYSGLFPPGWDFYDTNAADYEQRARRWAADRAIADGLCRVDIESGSWTEPADVEGTGGNAGLGRSNR